ncbi:hypothetical protein Tco_1024844, partial [Tanacetum coccineum]
GLIVANNQLGHPFLLMEALPPNSPLREKKGSRWRRKNPDVIAPLNLPRVSLRRLHSDGFTRVLTSSLAIPDAVASFGDAVSRHCMQFLHESWYRAVVLSVSSPNEPKSRVFPPKAIQMLKTLKEAFKYIIWAFLHDLGGLNDP